MKAAEQTKAAKKSVWMKAAEVSVKVQVMKAVETSHTVQVSETAKSPVKLMSQSPH